MTLIRQWHWGLAFGIACMLHLGLAVMMVWKVEDPPAEGLGKGGLEIQLTRSGSRPAESAHTRNKVREAAQRASGEAAPLVRANKAEKAVAPDESARDDSRPELPDSPVPNSAEAVSPASVEQPRDLADALPLAAPVANAAVPPNEVVEKTVAEEVPLAATGTVQATVTAQAVQSVTAAATVVATPVDAAAEVQARPVNSPTGDVPPPDVLPPLEQVTSVSPERADDVPDAVAPQSAPVAEVSEPLPAEQAVTRPLESAPIAVVPLATATQPKAEEAVAAAPRLESAPSVGNEAATRSGDDVQTAGAVGPDEAAKALATGTNARTSPRGGTGSGEDRRDAAGGQGGDKSRYISLVQAWIQMHRRYPEKAREAKQEGVALVYVVVGRDGIALEFRILQSTGFPLLDAEILEAVERAMPFPEIPGTVGQDQLKLILPVRFALK